MIARARNVLLVLAPLLVASQARAVDVVTLVPGSKIPSTGGKISGQVQSESPAELKIQSGGKLVTIPADQIAEVAYEGPTPSYVLAASRASAGQIKEAMDLYKKAASEAPAGSRQAGMALYDFARLKTDQAMADPSQADEAIAAWDALLRGHSDTHFAGPALLAEAQLALQKGDLDKADAAAGRLGQIAWAAPRSEVIKARILSRRGKHDEAIAALDRIAGAAPKGSEQAHEAALARAEALAALKKFPEAEAAARSVIDAAAPEDAATQARAYNTLGDCLRAAGKPKDALFAYYHTILLFDADKAQHPRALAEVVRLWRELGQPDRARREVDALREQYPQSPWLAAVTEARGPG